MKMPLGTEVELRAGHIVLDGFPEEAFLGMFSMFGRIGAATKRDRHKMTGKFLQHSILRNMQ